MTLRIRSRRAAVGAATLLILATAAAENPPGRGNVNGAVEGPIACRIRECIDIEKEARDDLNFAEPDEPLPSADAAFVRALLVEGRDCLLAAAPQAQAAVGNAGLQPRSNPGKAAKRLQSALNAENAAIALIDAGGKADAIRKKLLDALNLKRRAKRLLQGLPESRRTTDDNLPERHGPQTAEDAYQQAMNERDEFWRTHGRPDASGASASSRPDPTSSSPGAKKPPKDLYMAFRAKKGTAANGFAVFNLGRDLVGPFQAQLTAGVFTTDEAARAALGNAFACFEFDIKGSEPLEFLSICARPSGGGVQVFASTRAGNLGQSFFASTDQVVLDVVYDGTTFLCRARRPGESDASLVQFATFTRPQGADTWTQGIGGAGLGGKAEVGVDDYAIWALDPAD